MSIRDRTLELANKVGELGWNQPAQIWVVMNTGDGPEYVKVVEVPLAIHPVEALDVMTQYGTPPNELEGLGMVSEGWAYPQRILDEMVKIKEAGGSMDDINHYLDKIGAPSEQEDRVELRMFMYMDATGETFGITETRGGDVEELSERDSEGESQGVTTGELPNAMRRFFRLPEVPYPGEEQHV